jgi:hypothetical protein
LVKKTAQISLGRFNGSLALANPSIDGTIQEVNHE